MSFQVPEPVQNGLYSPNQQTQPLGGSNNSDPNVNYQSQPLLHQQSQQGGPQHLQNGYHSNGYIQSHTGLLTPKFPPPQTFDNIPDITNPYQAQNNNEQQFIHPSQQHPGLMGQQQPQQQHHNMPLQQQGQGNYFVTPNHPPVSMYQGALPPRHPYGGPPHMNMPGQRPSLPGYNGLNGYHPGVPPPHRMHNGLMSASPTGSNNTSPGRESGSEESSSDDSVQASIYQ